jgi:hypothetical protein
MVGVLFNGWFSSLVCAFKIRVFFVLTLCISPYFFCSLFCSFYGFVLCSQLGGGLMLQLDAMVHLDLSHNNINEVTINIGTFVSLLLTFSLHVAKYLNH